MWKSEVGEEAVQGGKWHGWQWAPGGREAEGGVDCAMLGCVAEQRVETLGLRTVCEAWGRWAGGSKRQEVVRTTASPEWISFAIVRVIQGTRGEFIHMQSAPGQPVRDCGKRVRAAEGVVSEAPQAGGQEGRSADARPVRRPFQSGPGPLQDGGAGRHMGQGSWLHRLPSPWCSRSCRSHGLKLSRSDFL